MNRLLPRNWTIRGRLTVLYAALFFTAGAVLLALTYLLVSQILLNRVTGTGDTGQIRALLARFGGTLPVGPGGQEVPVDDVLEAVRASQEQIRADVLDSLLVQGIAALLGVGLVAAAFGWLLARRALQPVHQITETARRIASGHGLRERISLTGPRDEVTELADTVNAMLSRLDESFDGQQRFIANASHEMRTPLAVKRALIEVAVTRPDTPEDTRRLGEALLEVNARHERLIDGLLTLADSESELTERSPVDLADVAEHVLHQLAGAAREAGVDVRPPGLAPAPVAGDPVLLERLVQNLVENAVRHNRPGGWLSVTVSRAGGLSVLTVSNSGRVVRPYEVPVLFQPFRRLDRDRVAGDRGFGLGLSIARAAGRAHGGDVLAEPRPDGGLDVTLRLPWRADESRG